MTRWMKALTEGSLLRRTLMHIGVFAVGSLAFVAFVSTLLVSTARAILPSTEAEAATATTADGAPEKAADKAEGAEKGAKKAPGQT